MHKERTGVGEYTYELLDVLFEIDKENNYILFYNSWKDVSDIIPKWNQKNVHYIITRWPNKLFSFFTWLRVIKLDHLIERRFVKGNSKFITTRLDYFFSPNLNFTCLSKKIKHIITIHDLSFEFFKKCYSWKRRLWHRILNPSKQCRRANIVLVPSENTKLDVGEIYNISKEKIKVIIPGLSNEFLNIRYKKVNEDDVRKKYSLPQKYILFLGTIEPRKNIIGVIEAYKKVYGQKFGACGLVIAGARGWKYDNIINDIDKTPGAQYVGYVDAEDKPALYSLAETFVYPSLYEGFGFPVLEALVCGTPVITSNRSSLPEVVGDYAYLVNPYNIHEIEKGLQFFQNKKQTYIDLESFNWRVSAQNFLLLLT